MPQGVLITRMIIYRTLTAYFSKLLQIFILAILFASCISDSIPASIIGSPHDISAKKCFLCHIRDPEKGDAALWNISGESITFSAYDSPTRDMENILQSDALSMLCLGCHNGVVAELIISNIPDTSDDEFYQPRYFASSGINPMYDHPIRFTYIPERDIDNNGFPQAVPYKTSSSGKAIPGKKTGTYYPLFGINGNQFECSTCHMPHYGGDAPLLNTYQIQLLRTENTRSSLCRDCHTKKY